MILLADYISQFNLASLLIDACVALLIWLVQLIIYPSFLYMESGMFAKWHRSYTSRISLFVGPLMLMQLILTLVSLFQTSNHLSIIKLILILAAWGITFVKAVPLHNQLDANPSNSDSKNHLIRINWYRTILWSLVLVVSIADYIKVILQT